MSGVADNKLSELMKAINDGVNFYGSAKSDIDSPVIEGLFNEMYQHKIRLRLKLADYLPVEERDSIFEGTVAGAFRQLYTEVRAKFSSDEVVHYVKNLEEIEDKVLDAFNAYRQENSYPAVERVLADEYPYIEKCHNTMRNLKQEMEEI